MNRRIVKEHPEFIAVPAERYRAMAALLDAVVWTESDASEVRTDAGTFYAVSGYGWRCIRECLESLTEAAPSVNAQESGRVSEAVA